MSRSSAFFLLSQYDLLKLTAQYITAVDLLNLASTCSEAYSVIRRSKPVFERLKRVTLCDGRGLLARQQFRLLYSPYYYHVDGKGDEASYDEEIEVRVYNRKCDAANPLPCLKCKVNICEVRLLPL
jgi:hypothetical protein